MGAPNSKGFVTGLIALLSTLSSLSGGLPLASAAGPQDQKSWSDKLPPGTQTYLDRPDILKSQAQAHPNLGNQWTKLVRGHIETVAMLLEMYPDREIYFLARDSELLYDLARWETRNEPEIQKRIHLLNISRSNMDAQNVRDYLTQEGISRSTLSAGKQVIFVDTGFEGSIPQQLATYFPAGYQERLKTHLLVSGNGAFPSTRMFLTALDPKAPKKDPATLHDALVNYEHLPRFTERSNEFVRVDGRWHPVSPAVSSSEDGKVSKKRAVKYQEDLLSRAKESESRSLMRRRRSDWRKLRALSEEGKIEPIEAELRSILDKNPDDPFAEAMVRDFIEMHQTTLRGERILPLSAARMGLKAVPLDMDTLAERFPEYRELFDYPEQGIKKIIARKDWVALSVIADELDIARSQDLLIELHRIPVAKARTILRDLIGRATTDDELATLGAFFYSKDTARNFGDELLLLVEKMKPERIGAFARYLLPEDYARGFPKALRRMIERADRGSLEEIRVELERSNGLSGKKFEVYRQAAQIENRAQRVRFFQRLDQGLPAPETASDRGISPDLKNGDEVTTEQGRVLRVLERVDEGKRGVVFRVKDANGAVYALKVAKDDDPDTLESMGKEGKKAQQYQKSGLAHAKVIESAPTYALKEWIEGTRADEWIASWSKGSNPSSSAPQLTGLRKLVQGAAEAGVYVGDLNPKNLIWDGERWVIIDSGSVRDGKQPEQALERYLEKIPERWSRAAAVSKRSCVINKLTSALRPLQ